MMRRRELMGMQGVLKTATGPIVTVNDALARNAKSLIVNFAPVQASGTPAPDNVLPISGWTGCSVWQTGKNLLDTSDITDYSKWSADIAPSGDMPSNSDNRIYSLAKLKSGVQYTISFGVTSESYPTYLYFGYYKDGSATKIAYVTTGTVSNQRVTFTAIEGVTYCLRLGSTLRENLFNAQIAKLSYVQLELGSTATAYEPYQGTTYPVDWTDTAGTVYGGYVDLVSGVLVATWASITFDGTEGWSYQAESTTYNIKFLKHLPGLHTLSSPSQDAGMLSYIPTASQNSDLAKDGILCGRFGWVDSSLYIMNATEYLDGVTDMQSFRNYLSNHPLQVVYPLATPITYQLTPQTIAMLRGTNNVWSNANGNVELTYYAQ